MGTRLPAAIKVVVERGLLRPKLRVARVLAASLLVCACAALRHLSAIKDRLRALRRRSLTSHVQAANLSPISARAGAGAHVSARGRVKVRCYSESLLGEAMSTLAESCIPRFFFMIITSKFACKQGKADPV